MLISLKKNIHFYIVQTEMRNFFLIYCQKKKKSQFFCDELKTFYPGWEIANENKATDIKDKGGASSGQT